MKKLLLLFLLLLFTLIFALPITTFAEEADELLPAPPETTDIIEEPPPDTEEEAGFDTIGWLKEKLAPNVITVVVATGALLISLRPLLETINRITDQTKSMLESFGKNKDDDEKKTRELAEQLKTVAQQLKDAQEQLAQYQETVGAVLESCNTQKQMLQLGFGNSAELVKKGTARTICALAEGKETQHETQAD